MPAEEKNPNKRTQSTGRSTRFSDTRKPTTGAKRPSSSRGPKRRVPLASKSHRVPEYNRVLSSGKPRLGKKIPPLEKDVIRVMIFGGVEEVGRNMAAIEYNGDIVIVDCGVLFSDPNYPGVQFILPNPNYLVENKDKIRAILVTHGHLDHIGAIPYFIERFGYPPIYSRKLTLALLKNKVDEHKTLKPLQYNEVEGDSKIALGNNLSAEFFAVSHTIPDSMGIIFNTPHGDIVFTGDLKLSHVEGKVNKEEVEEFKKFEKRNVLLTLADSTNAENPGFSLPEAKVAETLKELIREAKGRVIIGSFASQIDRNAAIIEDSIAIGKKVAVEGSSMKKNLGIALELGLLKVDLKKRDLIPVEEIEEFPENKIVVCATGALGQEYSALDRMSNKTHRHIKLNKNDTVILSSSIIPGSERDVQTLKDKISRFGCTILTFQTSDVHSSGHANRDELKWIHEHIKAKFFVPLHGYHYMLTAHSTILRDLGMPEENIILPKNGSVMEISEKGTVFTHREERAPAETIIVDGNAIGDIQPLVLRDRKMLSEEGMVVAIAIIDHRSKRLKKSPDIISRGFVYINESQEILQKARSLIKRSVETQIRKGSAINKETVKKDLTKELTNFFFHETNKKPVVVPVIFVF